jgi:imidazole glycerol-phosphate synthase subunit HisH
MNVESKAVTVLDYGIGNLLNVVRALTQAGATVRVTQRASAQDAESGRMVLPGVGAFGDGVSELRARGFDDLVKRFADTGRPFLGICVGMQVLFDGSDEMGDHVGFGILPGRVRAVPAVGADGLPHRIPHIGWRSLQADQDWSGTVLGGVQAGERVYFVHSFAAQPEGPAKLRLATVDYDGVPICAAVRGGPAGNVYGCQFHPERSAGVGLSVLRNFLSL